MKKVIIILSVLLYSCECNDKPKSENKELIFQTEHCRWYCLSRNGFNNCKVVACECDEGYDADASVSW